MLSTIHNQLLCKFRIIEPEMTSIFKVRLLEYNSYEY